MASSGTANAGDASNNVRPTEAQLRWAQFHHKRRAQGVKFSIVRLYQTPERTEDVVGAYPEDGNSSTSISEADTRQRRPRVSKGRRAYLRVSRRKYKQRAQEIQDEGFRRLQGVDTFSDGEEEDNELNDMFMTKRRRQRRRKGEDIERLKRFEDACHAMMMNLAQPEEQVITIPAKRWTRTADHIAASAMLEEEYLDPKWGIRRRALDTSKDGGENQFNLQHRAMTPVDRSASWLMHLPDAIPSSRDNPSSYFYINKQSVLTSGTSMSDGISEGSQSVSTLAMKAPGQQKFNQLVALAQRQLIEQQYDHFQNSRRLGHKPSRQDELKNPHMYGRSLSPQEEQSTQSKTFKSYMPRMRLRDFVLVSQKGEDDVCSEDELNHEELAALNQIPKDKYLQALRLSNGSDSSLTRVASLRKQEIDPDLISRIRTIADMDDTSATVSESKLQPEELAIMECIVSRQLRDLAIEPYETRTRHLDMADEIVQEVEAAEEVAQNGRLRHLFDSINKSPNQSQEYGLGLGKVMALQQIITARIKNAEGQDSNEASKRYSRAKVMAAAFDSNNMRFIGLPTRTLHRSSAATIARARHKSLYHGEAAIQPEELIVMSQGISLHLERELQGKEKGKVKSSFRRTVGIAGIWKESEGKGKDTTNIMREMYDVFEKHADGHLSVDGALQFDEVFVLRNMIRSRIQAIENGGNVSEIKRLTRAKLIAQVFEADKHERRSGRIKEMVQVLESENKLIRYGKDLLPSSSAISSDTRRLSEPISKTPTHPEREPRYSGQTGPRYSNEQGQQIPALDTTLQGLWNRGKNGLSGISAALSHESASNSVPKPIRDTAVSVSEKVHLLFRNSKWEQNQLQSSGHNFSIQTGSLSVSDRVDLYLDNLKAVQDSGTGTGMNQTATQSEDVSDQFEKLLRNFQKNEEYGTKPEQDPLGDPLRIQFRQPTTSGHRFGIVATNQMEQEVPFLPGDKSTTSRRRNEDDSDGAELQPQLPLRIKVEQEISDAIETTLPKQDTVKEYAPDELDVDFLAAYRKKRESIAPTDDASSASSYKVLPSGFREVVKQYSPSGHSQGFALSTAKQDDPSHSEGSRQISKLSEENMREFARKTSPGDTIDLGVIDSDEIVGDAGRRIDPSLLSSLMLSPDLLTKRHQQAVRAIERSQWDDVNYLINANPWLAEMSELTTKQYLLHKIAFFGAGHVPAPVELCELLMDKFPAAVHKFDEDGNVPLHLAAAAGHMKMIAMLGETFESGASIRNEDGMLPLHFALASYGRLGFAATPGANSQNGESAEPIQVMQKVLCFFPQAVAISDNDGNLPLHIAVHCLEGQVAIDAILLLLDEAETQLKNPYGARFYNKVKVEETLGDGFPEAFTSNDEEDLDTDLHCMVRNNASECPLVLAIHERKGWQIIDTLVASRGGKESALFQDSDGCNALHLLVGEYQDPAAALSILKTVPETTTIQNSAGMLPIEVACMQLMPDEVILAIALADLHIDLNGDDVTKIRKNFGGSWWFLTCECDDHYVGIVRNLVSMCSFEQVRMLCVMEGGSSQNKGTVIARATPKCREVLAQATRFLGRFEFVGKTPLYSDVDRRIKAFDALDFGGGIRSSDEGRRVLLKSYSLRDVFLVEVSSLYADEMDLVTLLTRLQTEIMRTYELDESKVEEVLTFSVRGGGDGLSGQSWVSIECPEATLKDVSDSMTRKGGYWNQPDLRSKYATKVCLVLRLIAKSLQHLHTKGVVHGDLSLQSCGLFEQDWKLLGGMEVQPIGQAFDTSRFQQSFPPESLHSSDLDINVYDTDAPPVCFNQSIVSDPSIDIWSFGKLAYEAILGKPLVAYDANLPANDVVALLEVMEWNEDCLKDVFQELLESGGIAESGAELFTSCLFPRPEDRPKSMDEILRHPFWQQNIKQRKKSRGSLRRRNTDSISVFTETSKSLFTELSD